MVISLIILLSLNLILKPNIRDFSVLDTNNKRLMIIAHPDDEVMWAFNELINEDYLVVCMTCGSNKKRIKEFTRVMKYTNDDYIMLNYPDKVNGERSNWSIEYSNIKNDLERIIGYKRWDIVLTHNPKGEYGHIQHILTSNIVTDISDKNNLMYFGKYYKNNKLPSNLKKIDNNILDKKKYVINNFYKSQKNVLNGMSHMYSYEKIISYREWNEVYE